MAAYVKYFPFIEHVVNELVDLFGTTDNFFVCLTNTAYTPAQTHDELAASITQLTGTGYTAGGADITNDSTRSSGTVTMTTADTVVFTATAGDWTAGQEVVCYDDTSTGKKLMCYWDYGTTYTVGNGETFTVDFGASLCTVA